MQLGITHLTSEAIQQHNMEANNALHMFLESAAGRWPENIAVDEPNAGVITYQELDRLANQVRDYLVNQGVQPGDRVGVYLRKSIDAIGAIFGILKAGAAYVPVDPGAPVARNAFILNDCSVQTVVIEQRFAEAFGGECKGKQGTPNLLVLQQTGGGQFLRQAIENQTPSLPAAETVESSPNDLAYVLYTSGSTGKPKGVMLTHRNATSFVNWCSDAFKPHDRDRFSSHAPLHFDLSILDLYLSIKHGATLVLIDDSTGKSPAKLAPLIEEKQISIWYSTPSILSLLAEYGKLGELDLSAVRIVFFAGEVFPVKHLRALKTLLPDPTYFNLYGPTETNVCTYYEIPSKIPEDRKTPFPIGFTCSHVQTMVIDETGQPVGVEQEGELCVTGDGVTQGYWNLPEQTENAFFEDAQNRRWYKTGDLVRMHDDESFTFVGRRDRMVKKRGYRVELGEIESGLYRHPQIKEAATIAISDEDNGLRIVAFISCHNGKRPSIIELKRFCSSNLPAYMIPDLFSIQDTLPKTSTDKINYEQLKREPIG